MEEHIVQTKSAASLFSGMERFSVQEQEEHEYEHYVNLTAKLIKRPYFQTHKMVERWPLETIKRHYELCTKHAGDMPGDVKWWWLRKQSKQGDTHTA